eukprot:jgi/Chrpa1/21025/Chrysochromulina_OHIO_Genome00025652-RA
MLWIMRRLQDEDADVCFLLEVMGSHEAFTAETHGLRALAAKIGYNVRWMVGEGGSQREQLQSGESHTNGIAVLVKKATCTIERYVRIEERVLGVWIRGRNSKEQIRMRIAAIHGLHHEGTSSFNKQLQATYAWAADAAQESKGCLVVGDFNYVADVAWRSSGAGLDAKDKLFRDFITQPAASSKPLSDHAWITFSREIPEVVYKGEKRPRSAIPRGDECIKNSYRDLVRKGDVHEEILRAQGTVHATTAAVQALRRAAEQATAEYANQRLRRKQQREDARLKELSLGIVEGKGSKDLAQVAMLAWKAIRPQRISLAFDRFHPRDDVREAPMLAADDPDAFLNGLAREGDRLVKGLAATPPIIDAFKAFCKVFCPTYETLRGRDGGEWELIKELTFPVFLQVLKRVPRGKAVGHGGFSIELLIHADREIKRAFYECLMADLRGGEFPPSWRKVIYVLLAKPPPSNQALISERREIALMAQDMKLVMHMIRATAYRLITGRLRSEQCGWLP